jgi:hypothetical protein
MAAKAIVSNLGSDTEKLASLINAGKFAAGIRPNDNPVR